LGKKEGFFPGGKLPETEKGVLPGGGEESMGAFPVKKGQKCTFKKKKSEKVPLSRGNLRGWAVLKGRRPFSTRGGESLPSF